MARTTIVHSARKDQGVCRVCQRPLPVGSTYKWVSPRYMARVVACVTCTIPQAMISRRKTAGLEDSVSGFNAGGDDPAFEDLSSDLTTLAEEAREVGQEYQESADNLGEYFEGSEQHSELEEQASALDEYAEKLDAAASEVEDKGKENDPEEELDDSEFRDEWILENKEDGEYDEEAYQQAVGENKGEMEKERDDLIKQAWEEAQGLAQEAVDEFSI